MEIQQKVPRITMAYLECGEKATLVSVNCCLTHLVLQDLLALSAHRSSSVALLLIAKSGISWDQSDQEPRSEGSDW
jgi:hypothetical protein